MPMSNPHPIPCSWVDMTLKQRMEMCPIENRWEALEVATGVFHVYDNWLDTFWKRAYKTREDAQDAAQEVLNISTPTSTTFLP